MMHLVKARSLTARALRAALACGCAAGLVAAMLLAPVALAQDRRQETPVEIAPAPAPPPAPERQPGLLENFGRWMDETNASMRKGFDNAWRGMGGMGDQATSAAKGTADVAATAAKGAADATRGSIDALGRLGNTRLVTGRERCAIAPNGAPDCRLAAEAMCKGKGFTTGSSVDYQTAENCPATAFLQGRKPATGECPIEHVVTKAMCQ
jgi:hypothetical protein